MMNIFIDDAPSNKVVKDVVSMADKGIKKMKGMKLYKVIYMINHDFDDDDDDDDDDDNNDRW